MAHKAVLYSVIGANMELLICSNINKLKRKLLFIFIQQIQIASVKSKAEDKAGIPPEQHDLVYKVDKLNDQQCINDYGIKTEETLILALRCMWW